MGGALVATPLYCIKMESIDDKNLRSLHHSQINMR
jgi:hypothetical protein